MSKNLVYVLAKVQFGQVTESKFMEGADAVQEALRKEYPIVNSHNTLFSFQIDLTNPSENKMSQKAEKIINISSADKKWAIRITRDFFIIQTNSYDGFGNFEARLKKILDVASENLSIYHTSFLGMRFINKFPFNPETNFNDVFKRSDFLQPNVNVPELKKSGSNLNSLYNDGVFWSTINSGISINSNRLPADLGDFPEDVGFQTNEILEGVWAHFDVDVAYVIQEGMEEFNVDKILINYNGLRDLANKIFNEVINVENVS